jgi:hypothetical protein
MTEAKMRNERALALVSAPVFEEAIEHLKARAVKDLLTAATPEDREEKWRGYHAFDRVVTTVKKWAEEARANPE